jgi:GNAT superfamily N-acetyltransferase
MAIEIQTVSIGDKLLDADIALWRAHSDTLGFMPKGAFEQAAREESLWANVEPQDQLRGYTLFRKSGGGIKIAHLCVGPSATRTGVARMLVQEITNRHPEVSGIGLWCGKDFQANQMWPRLGFSPRLRRQGRGQADGELIFWFNGRPRALHL